MARARVLVTFDVTNTLMRVGGGGVGHIYAKAAASHGIDLAPETVTQAFRSAYKQAEQTHPNFGHGSMTPFAWWEAVIRKTVAASAAPSSLQADRINAVSRTLYQSFCSADYWELMMPRDELDGVMRAVRAQCDHVGVISNFDERLDTILQALRIRDYFDFVLTSTEVGVAKPDKGIFEAARRHRTADTCVHVGDDVRRDAVGAARAGWRYLLVRADNSALPSDVLPLGHTVPSLGEVPQGLTTVLSRAIT